MLASPSDDAFHILEVDLWTWGPYLADIGTFAVHVLTKVILKTHKKWVPHTISDKDDMRRHCDNNIYIYIIVEYLLVL